ncbi:MAG: class I SAM-dependent methyltransferase [Chloroflexota bacterium]
MTENKDYNLDRFDGIIKELYDKVPPITLTPEYASWITNDLNRFLIRLARYKFVAKQLHKNDSVLEIGSGSGMGSIFLSQYCKSVKGVELKDYEVDEARSLNRRNNVEFELINFFDLPEREKYDAIVNLDVIEHLNLADGEKLVAETAMRLNPTGMLVTGTPSYYSLPHQSEVSRVAHVQCYKLDELTALISKYYDRVLTFCMNDEIVHTGSPKMAWYYYVLAFYPKA